VLLFVSLPRAIFPNPSRIGHTSAAGSDAHIYKDAVSAKKPLMPLLITAIKVLCQSFLSTQISIIRPYIYDFLDKSCPSCSFGFWAWSVIGA